MIPAITYSVRKKIKQHITELAIIPYHVVFKFLSIPISDLMLLISCESPSASLLNNNIHSILILDDDDVSTSSVWVKEGQLAAAGGSS